MNDQNKNDERVDLFGEPLETLPEPRNGKIMPPEELLEIIKNGPVAQTREQFLGIRPKEEEEKTEYAEAPGHVPPPVASAPPEPKVPAPASPSLDDKVNPGAVMAGTAPGRRGTPGEDIPDLPVSDSDVDRFLSCIQSNAYYSETFTKGGFRVVFRVKSAVEIAWIRACVSRMIYDTGEIRTNEDMNQAILRFNLLLQTAEIGARSLAGVAAPGPPPWKPEDLNLEELFWRSEFGSMNEGVLFMVQAMMVQFERKVQAIERMLIDPKFSGEGGRS
jgi:hypothetical protein